MRHSFRSGFATIVRSRHLFPVLFIDAISVKVRVGQVSNRPFYVIIGVARGPASGTSSADPPFVGHPLVGANPSS